MDLEDLITACGFDFRDLSLHSPRKEGGPPYWIAKGGRKVFGHWKIFRAYTPNDAVAKLLSELTKQYEHQPHHPHTTTKS